MQGRGDFRFESSEENISNVDKKKKGYLVLQKKQAQRYLRVWKYAPNLKHELTCHW